MGRCDLCEKGLQKAACKSLGAQPIIAWDEITIAPSHYDSATGPCAQQLVVAVAVMNRLLKLTSRPRCGTWTQVMLALQLAIWTYR